MEIPASAADLTIEQLHSLLRETTMQRDALERDLTQKTESEWNLRLELASIEAEAKQESQKEVKRLESKLNFATNENLSLKKEYQKILGELQEQQEQQNLPQDINALEENVNECKTNVIGQGQTQGQGHEVQTQVPMQIQGRLPSNAYSSSLRALRGGSLRPGSPQMNGIDVENNSHSIASFPSSTTIDTTQWIEESEKQVRQVQALLPHIHQLVESLRECERSKAQWDQLFTTRNTNSNANDDVNGISTTYNCNRSTQRSSNTKKAASSSSEAFNAIGRGDNTDNTIVLTDGSSGSNHNNSSSSSGSKGGGVLLDGSQERERDQRGHSGRHRGSSSSSHSHPTPPSSNHKLARRLRSSHLYRTTSIIGAAPPVRNKAKKTGTNMANAGITRDLSVAFATSQSSSSGIQISTATSIDTIHREYDPHPDSISYYASRLTSLLHHGLKQTRAFPKGLAFSNAVSNSMIGDGTDTPYSSTGIPVETSYALLGLANELLYRLEVRHSSVNASVQIDLGWGLTAEEPMLLALPQCLRTLAHSVHCMISDKDTTCSSNSFNDGSGLILQNVPSVVRQVLIKTAVLVVRVVRACLHECQSIAPLRTNGMGRPIAMTDEIHGNGQSIGSTAGGKNSRNERDHGTNGARDAEGKSRPSVAEAFLGQAHLVDTDGEIEAIDADIGSTASSTSTVMDSDKEDPLSSELRLRLEVISDIVRAAVVLCSQLIRLEIPRSLPVDTNRSSDVHNNNNSNSNNGSLQEKGNENTGVGMLTLLLMTGHDTSAVSNTTNITDDDIEVAVEKESNVDLDINGDIGNRYHRNDRSGRKNPRSEAYNDHMNGQDNNNNDRRKHRRSNDDSGIDTSKNKVKPGLTLIGVSPATASHYKEKNSSRKSNKDKDKEKEKYNTVPIPVPIYKGLTDLVTVPNSHPRNTGSHDKRVPIHQGSTPSSKAPITSTSVGFSPLLALVQCPLLPASDRVSLLDCIADCFSCLAVTDCLPPDTAYTRKHLTTTKNNLNRSTLTMCEVYFAYYLRLQQYVDWLGLEVGYNVDPSDIYITTDTSSNGIIDPTPSHLGMSYFLVNCLSETYVCAHANAALQRSLESRFIASVMVRAAIISVLQVLLEYHGAFAVPLLWCGRWNDASQAVTDIRVGERRGVTWEVALQHRNSSSSSSSSSSMTSLYSTGIHQYLSCVRENRQRGQQQQQQQQQQQEQQFQGEEGLTLVEGASIFDLDWLKTRPISSSKSHSSINHRHINAHGIHKDVTENSPDNGTEAGAESEEDRRVKVVIPTRSRSRTIEWLVTSWYVEVIAMDDCPDTIVTGSLWFHTSNLMKSAGVLLELLQCHVKQLFMDVDFSVVFLLQSSIYRIMDDQSVHPLLSAHKADVKYLMSSIIDS